MLVGASKPPAMFMECTHDNEMPGDLKSVLVTAALCCMLPCAVGTVRGFDEMYGKRVDLVRERRRYEVPRKEWLEESGEMREGGMLAGTREKFMYFYDMYDMFMTLL